MRRAIWYFVQIAAAIALAVWLADRPGTVTLQWQGWRVDTSIGVLVAALFVVTLAAVWLYRVGRFLRRAPGSALVARRTRRQAAGYRALTQGMVALAAGDAEEARRQARKADALLGEPPLTMLLSAQAAQLGGDETAAKRYFNAMLTRPETEFLGLRGLLMQAMREGAHEEALALAKRARTQRPDAPWLLDALFQLYSRSGRWLDAQALVEEASRRKLVDRETARGRRAALLVERSRATDTTGDTAGAVQQARKAHELQPALVPAAVQLARLLADQGHTVRARKVIERTWALAPHPSLAAALRGLFAADEPLERLQSLRKTMAAHLDHPETQLALGEAALEAELWGEARRYLEAAADTAPSARAFRALARLEAAERGDDTAGRQWLARASEVDADAAWRCRACGAQADDWHPVCGQCGAFASIGWRASPRGEVAIPVPVADEPEDPAEPARAAG